MLTRSGGSCNGFADQEMPDGRRTTAPFQTDLNSYSMRQGELFDSFAKIECFVEFQAAILPVPAQTRIIKVENDARRTRTKCMARKRKAEGKPKTSGKPARRLPYQVFVSHANADKWLATTFCEKIEAVGATTFRDDRDINGGDNIPEEIRMQIVASREMVVLLTPESVDRPWVLLEVGAAWGRRSSYRIVPVLCHVTVDAIPDIIEGKKAFHLNEFDQYLKELEKRVIK